MKKHEQYSVGLYCRLSKDDLGSGDSSSIISQKTMLNKYVCDNGWNIFDYYVDDGYSGTNYNRPAFQRMIEDIEAGKINMVVVKDLSRLGRNYILTGQYTDIYFPDRGIRFIALNDGIDTKNDDNDIAPFRNILNQMYSTDISKKVRSAVKVKKQKGEYLSNYAPYGYQKDFLNRNKLIIEESGAEVVRRIYGMCAGGCGSPAIAKALNKDKIPTPKDHRKRLNSDMDTGLEYEWSAETIHAILRSRIYKGDMIQGVYDCSRFKRTPSKRKPKSDWIITLNTHDPIIDDELWNYVQKCMDSRKKVRGTGELQLFAGFIKCADCGYALAYARRYGTEYYSCGLYRRKGLDRCTQHYINKQVLIEVVLDDIRKYAKMAQEDIEGLTTMLTAQSSNKEQWRIQALNDELKALKLRLDELDKIIEQLYEDRVTNSLSDSRYQKLLNKYETEQSEVQQSIDELKPEIQRLSEDKRDIAAWLGLIKDYADIQELDRIVLGELVEKITVSEIQVIDGVKNIEITIYYRFVGAISSIKWVLRGVPRFKQWFILLKTPLL